ncbi:lysophospholipid acyltransferase family protein [Propionibacterium sp.]|uniref:lysophospholipid acyltransferase family protein n=1 Tax=Propionibacterium sp. TaxID=1977903 RepID=UPI0039E8CA53
MTSSTPQVQRSRLYAGKLGRVNHEPANRAFATSAHVASVLLTSVARLHHQGQEWIPALGGVIITPNHVSDLDPLIIAHYLAYSGRWPHFLARADLFDIRGFGRLLRAVEQIPVVRGARSAADSLRAAGDAIEQGLAVIIYPEGTFTYDPDEWPMAGHTGAARLALATGAPVVPIGQWGANAIIPARHKKPIHLFPRSDVWVQAGPPVHLADLVARGEHDRRAVFEATARIMDAITAQVGRVRGLEPPPERWHPDRRARVPVDEAVL